ncbi:hypothetical protein, partial [Tetragenococcus halophilus]|uniref:hypothetical protein n=1 Tax=Tetragenococcus halophilus TaxID=51669 RepID=UPI0030100A78
TTTLDRYATQLYQGLSTEFGVRNLSLKTKRDKSEDLLLKLKKYSGLSLYLVRCINKISAYSSRNFSLG